MIKLVALMKAKPGLARAQFIRRYEEQHAPLIERLMPFFSEYRRSYPSGASTPAHIAASPLPGDFDVVTELWYDDQSALERQSVAMAGGIGEQVARDEEDQFDRRRMVMFAADERRTSAERLAPRPAAQSGMPPIRTSALLRRRGDLSRDAFMAYYETNHAALASRIIVTSDGVPLFADYRRTYPLPGPTFPIGEALPMDALPFDVITDMWFWNEADYQAFMRLAERPDIAETLTRDEEQLFDRSTVVAFRSDEFISLPIRPA